jgi:hypothetical protein
MLTDLLPSTVDNTFRGRRIALWLFGLLAVKVAMGVNVILNAESVATTADGIPVQSFGAAGASSFLSMFAAWGLSQLLLGLGCLLVLVRYRSLVPLMFLLALLEQVGRKTIQLFYPITRIGDPPGTYVNAVLLGIMVLGLVLSLWRSPQYRGRP